MLSLEECEPNRPPRSQNEPLASGTVQLEIIIGRGLECDVVIKDAKASRKHCRLVRKPDGFLLEDLGSRNGTFFEGKKISTPVNLRADQAFKIGDTVFYLSH